MKAETLPISDIPALAERVTPEMLAALGRIDEEHSIAIRRVNGVEADSFHRLADLGLVDVLHAGAGNPDFPRWYSNLNGRNVILWKTGIRTGPHYTIDSSELAAWLERLGADRWWGIGGGRVPGTLLPLPCPADELADRLRRYNRFVVVKARPTDADADGRRIGANELDRLVGTKGDNLRFAHPGDQPSWARDRVLGLSWPKSLDESRLVEDGFTTEMERQDAEEAAQEIAGA